MVGNRSRENKQCVPDFRGCSANLTLAYLDLFRLTPSHKILFILPAEYYSLRKTVGVNIFSFIITFRVAKTQDLLNKLSQTVGGKRTDLINRF
jgi:hypothetical protein